MKLELKHVAPYLPYGVELLPGFKRPEQKYILNAAYMEAMLYSNSSYVNWKMALRPLSDLTKEIEHNGERFVPMVELMKNPNNLGNDHYYWKTLDQLIYGGWTGQLPYWVVQKLQEWMFDTERLIEYGLAIDINTLKETSVEQTR